MRQLRDSGISSRNKRLLRAWVWKLTLGKTKVMVSGGITSDGLSKSKVGPNLDCSLTVKAYSVLCVQCGEWIHS